LHFYILLDLKDLDIHLNLQIFIST